MALEGELTPILVQMVKSANMNGLLDNDIESLSGCQQRVKARLHEIMQKDQIFGEEDFDRVNQSVRHLLNYGVYFSPSADLI